MSAITRTGEMTLAAIDGGARRHGKGQRLDFLCFTLGGEEFGIALTTIKQVVKPPPVTWVPRVDGHLLGVVSVRGAVVTLVDMGQLIGVQKTEWPRTARVLIIDHGEEQLGLLVDAVTQVRRIAPDELEQDASLAEVRYTDYILFLTRPTSDSVVVIIDVEAIIAEQIR